jgi:hypothetical protein
MQLPPLAESRDKKDITAPGFVNIRIMMVNLLIIMLQMFEQPAQE